MFEEKSRKYKKAQENHITPRENHIPGEIFNYRCPLLVESNIHNKINNLTLT